MDYLDILKRAWNITWRHKALWVLGFFAAAAGAGGGGNPASYSTGAEDFAPGSTVPFVDWISQNWVFFAIAGAVLGILALVYWVLSVAAHGGLVYGANEAAEERKPSLGASWRVGFSKWGRTFMIQFVLGLPVALLAFAMIAMLVGAGISAFTLAQSDEVGGAAFGGFLCCGFPLFLAAMIAGALIVSILVQLAIRYGVLADLTFGQAIVRAWNDLWAKKGVFVFWLVMLLPGFAYGLVALLFMLPFGVPSFLLFMDENYAAGAALALLTFFMLLIPGAIYGTFVSASWTVFFRRMTGMEAPPVRATAGPPLPVGPAVSAPQGPYATYAPVPAPTPGSEPPAPATPASAPPAAPEPAPPAPYAPAEPPIVDVNSDPDA